MPEGVNVGTTYVSVVPEVRGFGQSINRQIGGQVGGAGKSIGKKFGGSFSGSVLGGLKGLGGPMTAVLGAAGLGAVIKSSVDVEKAFSQTMNTMASVADVPKAQMEDLSRLAMKMGADTSFSANEAADAMLELAKGGISPANIQAGALKGTLTLAAAGGTDLSTAATIATNALNTFGLAGKDMNSVAAALAGGANASSASVESLGEALSQVGPGAKNAGLSLQDTVGVLSAFDSEGIKGSDAGTSLKTMLDRLTPSTDAAKDAMKKLGLDFTDAHGNFVPISNVAEQLRTRLSKLAPATRSAALETIFGSDAQRAATVLMDQGRAGIDKYIKATQDQGAAERVAAARTSGTAGALEKMHGAVETAQLALGRMFAPAVVAGADLLGKGATAAANGIDKLMGAFQAKPPKPIDPKLLRGLTPEDRKAMLDSAKAQQGAFGQIAQAVQPLIGRLQAFGATLMPIVNDGKRALVDLGGAFMTMGKALLPTLIQIGEKIAAVLGPAIRDIGQMITGQLLPAFTKMLPVITPIVKFLLNVLGGAVVGALKGAVNVIKGVLNIIIGTIRLFTNLLTGNWSGAWDALKQIISGAFRAIIGLIQVALNVGVMRVFKLGFGLLRAVFTGGWALLRGAAAAGVTGIERLLVGGLRLLLAPFRALGTGALNVVRGSFGAIRGVIGKVLAGIRGLVTGGLKAIWAGFKFYIGLWSFVIRNGFNIIRGIVSTVLGAVRGIVTRALGAIRGAFSAGFNAAKSVVSSAFGGIRSTVSSGIGKVVGFFKGLPGKVTGAVKGLGGSLLGIGRDMVRGLTDGIKGMAGTVVDTLVGLLPGPLKRFAHELGITSPSTVFRTFGRYVVEGFTKGIRGSSKDAEGAVDRLATMASRIARENGTAALRRSVGSQNKALDGLLHKRIDVANRLAAANKAAAQAPQFAADVRSNILQGVDVTGMGGEADSIRQGLAAAVTNTKAFQRNLDVLRKRGLNKDALNQIIAAGVEQGGATAEGLARANAGQLKAINTLQSQLKNAATATGKSAADAMYGAGSLAAKGLINGLTAQQKAIEAQMLKIANGMKGAIKKALHIKSPSAVMASIGDDVASGLALGITGGTARVSAAAGALAGAAAVAPRAPYATPDGTVVGGGASIVVNADVRETADITMLINRLEYATRAGSFG